MARLAARTGASRCRLRFLDRGTGSDDASWSSYGRAALSEFEREILRERTRVGLAHARQNGKRLGRPMTAPCSRLSPVVSSQSELRRQSSIVSIAT